MNVIKVPVELSEYYRARDWAHYLRGEIAQLANDRHGSAKKIADLVEDLLVTEARIEAENKRKNEFIWHVMGAP